MSVVAFPLPDHKIRKSGWTGPTADEGLQLIDAFKKIKDDEKRAQLIRLAQRFSAQDYPASS